MWESCLPAQGMDMTRTWLLTRQAEGEWMCCFAARRDDDEEEEDEEVQKKIEGGSGGES